jgi:hypothetical protein
MVAATAGVSVQHFQYITVKIVVIFNMLYIFSFLLHLDPAVLKV